MSHITGPVILLLFLYRLQEKYHQLQVEGRTKMQKIIYLLSRESFLFNYHFVGYHYGPYSKELQRDLGILSTFELIKENVEDLGTSIRYSYELTKNGINRIEWVWKYLSDEKKRQIDDIAEKGSKLNEKQLNELLDIAYDVAKSEGIL